MVEEIVRCGWCQGDTDYLAYHDLEWGTPLTNGAKLFEFLILEGAQAGLSWITILKRRSAYRKAFCDFDPAKVAAFDEDDKKRLLLDSGIIRNRQKIVSAINNARCYLEMQDEFVDFLWSFVEGAPIQNQYQSLDEIPAWTSRSDRMSRELKQKGFSFVGPTICYAFMQATGMVNDHLVNCFRHSECAEVVVKSR